MRQSNNKCDTKLGHHMVCHNTTHLAVAQNVLPSKAMNALEGLQLALETLGQKPRGVLFGLISCILGSSGFQLYTCQPRARGRKGHRSQGIIKHGMENLIFKLSKAEIADVDC